MSLLGIIQSEKNRIGIAEMIQNNSLNHKIVLCKLRSNYHKIMYKKKFSKFLKMCFKGLYPDKFNDINS